MQKRRQVVEFSVWVNVWPKHPILSRFCVIEAWKYLFWPWTIRHTYGGAVVTASVTLEGTSGIALRLKMVVYNQTWAQSEIYQPVYVFAFSCNVHPPHRSATFCTKVYIDTFDAYRRFQYCLQLCAHTDSSSNLSLQRDQQVELEIFPCSLVVGFSTLSILF